MTNKANIKIKRMLSGGLIIGALTSTTLFLAHAESTEKKAKIISKAEQEVASAQKKIDVSAIEKEIKKKYPSTQINSVDASPISGLYEVNMGKNIAYTDAQGRYFLFGHVYDMHTQTDLTAQKVGSRVAEVEKGVFPQKFLDQALVTKKGNGKKIVALFTDPNCGYCKSLESELVDLTDVTIYKFIIPMLGNKSEAVSIWCADNPKDALKRKMIENEDIVMSSCNNPIQKNLNLAEDMGIKGTPFMIKPNGDIKYGYAQSNELQEWISL